MGGVPNAPGPSPTLGSLGPSHQWRHKSRASLRGPPCAHGVAGTPQGEVRDTLFERLKFCQYEYFLLLNMISVYHWQIVDGTNMRGPIEEPIVGEEGYI